MGDFFREITTFDYVAVGIVLLFAVRCTFRGFVKEVLSLAGLIGGVILARFFYPEAAAFFLPWVDKNQIIANVAGFAAIVIGVSLTASLTGWAISSLIRKSVLGFLDRIGGFTVGALQGIILIGLVVLLVEARAGSLDKTFMKDSLLAPYILDLMKYLSGLIRTTGARG